MKLQECVHTQAHAELRGAVTPAGNLSSVLFLSTLTCRICRWCCCWVHWFNKDINNNIPSMCLRRCVNSRWSNSSPEESSLRGCDDVAAHSEISHSFTQLSRSQTAGWQLDAQDPALITGWMICAFGPVQSGEPSTSTGWMGNQRAEKCFHYVVSTLCYLMDRWHQCLKCIQIRTVC